MKVDVTTATVISSWGSAGAGKTLVAINVAFELARTGKRVLLLDLDFTRPSVSAWLGLTSAGPGLTAALRQIRDSALPEGDLQALCAELKFGHSKLDVLTGLSSPSRWKEVSGDDIELLLSISSEQFDYIVIDLSDGISESEEHQGLPDSRAGLTSSVVDQSDLVLATFAADPVGINRILFDLRTLHREVWLIANRLDLRSQRRASIEALRETLLQLTSLQIHAELPFDATAPISTMAKARPLMLESPNSKLTLAIRRLAMEIADMQP